MGSIFDRGVLAADPCAANGHGALAVAMVALSGQRLLARRRDRRRLSTDGMGQKRGLLDLAAIKRHVFTTVLAPVVHVRGFLATNQVRLSLLVRAHHGALQKLRGMIGRDLDETPMIVPRLPVIFASKK